MIKNFAQAHHALRYYYEHSSAVGPYTLDRMHALLKLFGDPQNDLRVLHIAGTSGKTSTAYYAAALLGQAGYKTGLTVSPHIDELNERIQINLAPMSEKLFCTALDEFLARVANSNLMPSYFEIMVALAYYQFKLQQVDYAIVETGLGGLLDGTNTISRDDKVCIITDIGFDHTEVLGNTLPAIAAQKAGIIKHQNAVFMYKQAAAVTDTVVTATKSAQASLHLVDDTSPSEAAAIPLFQQRNFNLALAAVQYIVQRDGRRSLQSPQIAAAAQTHIPARMEVLSIEHTTLILDGAHNYQKLEALLRSIRAKYGQVPIAGLLAFVDGEPSRWQRALDVIMPQLSSAIFTSYIVEQDVPRHAVDPARLAQYCAAQGLGAGAIVADTSQAYKQLLTSRESLKLITGSLYLLNAVRPQVLAN